MENQRVAAFFSGLGCQLRVAKRRWNQAARTGVFDVTNDVIFARRRPHDPQINSRKATAVKGLEQQLQKCNFPARFKCRRFWLPWHDRKGRWKKLYRLGLRNNALKTYLCVLAVQTLGIVYFLEDSSR